MTPDKGLNQYPTKISSLSDYSHSEAELGLLTGRIGILPLPRQNLVSFTGIRFSPISDQTVSIYHRYIPK